MDDTCRRRSVPHQVGQSFKYSDVAGSYRKRDLAPGHDLLVKAKVITPIYHTDGQGIPLGASIDYRYFKDLFIDVALTQRVLDYHPKEWFLNPQNTLINKGAIIEAFVGQELLSYHPPQECNLP